MSHYLRRILMLFVVSIMLVNVSITANANFVEIGQESEVGSIFLERNIVWVDDEESIAKVTYELKGSPPTIGTDIVLMIDKSSRSMSPTLTKPNNQKLIWTIATFKNFISDIYEYNSDFRITMLAFSSANTIRYPSDIFLGAYDTVKGKLAKDYFYDCMEIDNNIKIVPAGLPYYDIGFKKVIDIINKRVSSEIDRPACLVFITGGKPDPLDLRNPIEYYDGVKEAKTLKASGVKIYTIGLEMSPSDFKTFVEPLATNSNYSTLVSNSIDLNAAYSKIAEELKSISTYGRLEDTINTDYFEIVKVNGKYFESSFGDVDIDYREARIIWDIGNIDTIEKTLSFYIKLREGVSPPAGNINVIYDSELSYFDYGGVEQSIEIDKGTITVSPMIYFDANGGEGEMPPIKGNDGQNIILSENIFRREGYIFRGWSTEYNGKLTYEDKSLLKVPKADTTLYAIWDEIVEPIVYGYEGIYDGKNHSMNILGLKEIHSAEYSADNGESWSMEKPQFIEVGEYDVKIKISSIYGDIDDVESKVTIKKKPLHIKALDGKKEYDGKELFNSEVVADGLIENHILFSIDVNGSQVEVGKSNNIPSNALILDEEGNAVTHNYDIVYQEGILEIIQQSSNQEDDNQPDDNQPDDKKEDNKPEKQVREKEAREKEIKIAQKPSQISGIKYRNFFQNITIVQNLFRYLFYNLKYGIGI